MSKTHFHQSRQYTKGASSCRTSAKEDSQPLRGSVISSGRVVGKFVPASTTAHLLLCSDPLLSKILHIKYWKYFISNSQDAIKSFCTENYIALNKGVRIPHKKCEENNFQEGEDINKMENKYTIERFTSNWKDY